MKMELHIVISNLLMSDGSKPRFIDFSHFVLHDCDGSESCDELINAYEILLLHKDKLEPSLSSGESPLSQY
jgi:hypothetical protein